MNRDYVVTVCAECLTAACWHGEAFCQKAGTASTVDRLASDLRKLRAEHPGNYSRAKLLKVCGVVKEAP